MNNYPIFNDLIFMCNKPFYQTFDDRYNTAIFRLPYLLKQFLITLDRNRRERNHRRIYKEPISFNKPKRKDLVKTWKEIHSCERLFKMIQKDQEKNETQSTFSSLAS